MEFSLQSLGFMEFLQVSLTKFIMFNEICIMKVAYIYI